MNVSGVVVVIIVLTAIFLVVVDQSFSSDDFLSLEQEASEKCVAKRGTDQPPLQFRYDGCSLWPNGNWVACCAAHDATYWCGGSLEDRFNADTILKTCVNSKTPLVGSLMYYGVRIAGTPWFPWSVRWGFGWEFGKGYK